MFNKRQRAGSMLLGILIPLTMTISGCSSSSASTAPTTAAGGSGATSNAALRAQTPEAQLGGDGSFARIWQNGLRICTTEDAPYDMKDAQGNWTGLDYEIVSTAVAQLKIPKVSYVIGPWDSMVANLQAGRCDFLQTNIHYTAQRAAVIDFTAPVYYYADSLVVRKGDPLNLHTWQDLTGHSVGAELGDAYVDWLDKRTDISPKTYKTWPELFSDLSNGRLDAAIVDSTVAGYYIVQNPSAQVQLATGYVPQTDLSSWARYGVQKGDYDLANAFSRVLDEMRVDGTLYTILAKYGVPETAVEVFKGWQP